MNNKTGFTLIEMLVVVLIIGILAAIAVPKYQLAVAKSKFVQLKIFAEAVVRAQDIYFLANGKYATNYNELDITIPNGSYFDGGYCYLEGQLQVGCYIPKIPIQYQVEYKGKYRKCISSNEISEKICQQETNKHKYYDTGTYKSWPYN